MYVYRLEHAPLPQPLPGSHRDTHTGQTALDILIYCMHRIYDVYSRPACMYSTILSCTQYSLFKHTCQTYIRTMLCYTKHYCTNHIQRYADYPNLLGIEVLNEPASALEKYYHEDLLAYYQAAYAIIRKYNKRCWVVVSVLWEEYYRGMHI